MGNQCTIDIEQVDFLDLRTKEIGSLQPKSVTVLGNRSRYPPAPYGGGSEPEPYRYTPERGAFEHEWLIGRLTDYSLGRLSGYARRRASFLRDPQIRLRGTHLYMGETRICE